MKSAIIYTPGPSCMKCRQTKRALEKGNVPFVERPIEEIEDLIAEKDYQVAPVVVTDDGHSWSDFRIDEIQNLIKQNKVENIRVATVD